MHEWKIVEAPWTVSETTCLAGLTIGPDGALAAPEGKSLTLTVDGAPVAVTAGSYAGDIAITVK